MANSDTLAQLAYAAYTGRVPGWTWDQLDPDHRAAWRVAATAVLTQVVTDMRTGLGAYQADAWPQTSTLPGSTDFQTEESRQRVTGVSRRAVRDAFQR